MLLLPLLCFFGVSAATRKQADRDHEEYAVCRTRYCADVATNILQSIDESVDPCENFYDYACGSWARNHPIPKSEVEWSHDQKVTLRTELRIKGLLEEREKASDIPPVKMAKRLYRSCMDLDAIERRGLRPIQEILDSIGGWPIAMPQSQWDEDKFPWQKVDLKYVMMSGDNALYNIQYQHDEQNATRNVLLVDMDIKYPFRKKHKRKSLNKDLKDFDLGHDYLNAIANVAREFALEKGHRVPRKQISWDAAQLVMFEAALQNITDEDENEKKSNNNSRMTIDELQEWYDSVGLDAPTAKINWLKVIQSIFSLAHVNISGSETVLVTNKEKLHKLAYLLNTTSPRVLVNYVHWNWISSYMTYTNARMRDIEFVTVYSKYNITEQQPRWKTCVTKMELQHAVSYQFVKKYSSNRTLNAVQQMVDAMQQELIHRVARAKWINNEMKEYMKAKLENIVKQIGYPSWYNPAAVTKFYEGLTIGSDYFQNILNCKEHDLIRSLTDFRKPTDRTQWLDYPITVNAFYSEADNSIVIPAAELQDPLFTPSLPISVNYGTVGFVLGHEMAHSLDSDGIQYDKDGNKVSRNMSDIMQGYEERAECFVEQFDEYILDFIDELGDPIKLDGQLTEDENIADTVGLQIAFAVYKTMMRRNPKLTKLPGLEMFSDEELFFLSFANAWCTTMRPEYESSTANSDEHSPPKFRVIGAVSNMNTFASVFKCSPDSRMNPPKKCSLWK